MQSTGIVPSSPTTACEVPNASWIDGISGPTPDDLRAQRQGGEEQRDERRGGATRQASGINERALAELEQWQRLPERRAPGSAGSRGALRALPRRRSARRERTCSGRPACRCTSYWRHPGSARESGAIAAQDLLRPCRSRPRVATHRDRRGRRSLRARFAAGCASAAPRPRRACAPRGRRRRAARADRVEQLDVPLGRLLRLHVGAVERDRDPALDAERLPALLEHRVARRLDDQAVERDVVLGERVRVVRRTASRIASNSTSSADTSPSSCSVASRAASSSSEARTG